MHPAYRVLNSKVDDAAYVNERSLLGRRELFWKLPASNVRPPSIHEPAILIVIGAELPLQSRLFIENHKEVYPYGKL